MTGVNAYKSMDKANVEENRIAKRVAVINVVKEVPYLIKGCLNGWVSGGIQGGRCYL